MKPEEAEALKKVIKEAVVEAWAETQRAKDQFYGWCLNYANWIVVVIGIFEAWARRLPNLKAPDIQLLANSRTKRWKPPAGMGEHPPIRIRTVLWGSAPIACGHTLRRSPPPNSLGLPRKGNL